MKFIVVFFFVIYAVSRILEFFDSGSPPSSINTTSAAPRNRISTTGTQQDIPKSTNTFRPKEKSKPKINFKGSFSSVDTDSFDLSSVSIEGLNDAFTGEKLDRKLGLNQCVNCKVFYHNESLQVLREANGSACVACQSKSIIAINQEQPNKTGRNYNPDVVTLLNYRNHEGSVITFEGKVERVQVSKRGIDYAIMFENKSWTNGFKLVFFGGSLERCGGSDYIQSLNGNTIKVRGLLKNDPTFGYEIIISQRSMILDDGFGNGNSRPNRNIDDNDLPF